MANKLQLHHNWFTWCWCSCNWNT